MLRNPKAAIVIALSILGALLAVAAAAGASTADIDQVVQLGDSYSAGYGVLDEDRSASDGDCLEPGFYDSSVVPGGVLAAQLEVPLEFHACGGAMIEDVDDQFRDVRTSIRGDGSGTVIVFTAGGNDLRSVRGEMWPDLLQRCILRDFSCERRSLNQIGNLDDVQRDLEALLTRMTRSVPGAQIRVLGYPELFQRSPWCFGVTGIDRNEADFLDRLGRQLNDGLEDVVQVVADRWGNDVEFVDVEDAFDDHGACQTARSGERFVNDTEFVPRSITVASNSFHPTARGYAAYSELFNASL